MMYFILTILLIAQFFCGHFCQLDNTFNGFSNEFTSENYLSALNEFRNKLLSSDIDYNCNISLVISFNLGRGFITGQCYNEIQNRTSGLHFHMITTIHDNRFLYDGRAYYVCLSDSVCDRSFINDWIPWQIHAIKNTIEAGKELKNKDDFSFTKFQFWSFMKHNETDLCFHLFIDQNKNLNTYLDEILSKPHESVVVNQGADNTFICLRCRYNHKSIIGNISAMVIKLNDLVTLPSSLDDKKTVVDEASTTLFYNMVHTLDRCISSLPDTNQTTPETVTLEPEPKKPEPKKPDNWSLLRIIILVAIILLILIALIICIVCCLRRKDDKGRYQETATG